MPSIGVLLGAGGVVGAAFHAGVLTALAEAGFDARRADLIVGTSAGSSVAASLRAGFPPIDLAPRSLGEPLSSEAEAIVGPNVGLPTIDYRPPARLRAPRPSSPGLVFRSGGRPAKLFAGLVPAGTVSSDVIGERVDALYRGVSWPEDPLWICAVDLENGQRIVFGRDHIDATVAVAVRASSSIPGVFRPVEHGGRRYVDGGVHSPTNADLLAGAGFDIVVIVSPMSTAGRGPRSLLDGARSVHGRRLASEIEQLRRSGTTVLTFQPTADVIAAMGHNPMDANRRERTTRTALESARTRLADPTVADRLAMLLGR